MTGDEMTENEVCYHNVERMVTVNDRAFWECVECGQKTSIEM